MSSSYCAKSGIGLSGCAIRRIVTTVLTAVVAFSAVGCSEDGNGLLVIATNLPKFALTGSVKTGAGAGVSGVVVSGGGNYTAVTDADGGFRLLVPLNWSGTLTPDSASFTFTPAGRDLLRVSGEMPGQDFVATPVAGNPPPPPPGGNPTVPFQTATATVGVAKTLTMTGTDPNGADLTFVIVTQPTRGTLGPVDNTPTDSATVVYTPTNTTAGTDTFTFKATNAAGGQSANATFSVVVSAATNPPPSGNPTVANQSDTTLVGVAKTLTMTGTDPAGGDLTFTVVSAPSLGTLGTVNNSATSSATVVYTPTTTTGGNDTFTFKATNAAGNSSGTATFTVTVTTPVSNGAPVAVNQTLATVTNSPKVFALAAFPKSGGALTYTVVSNPTSGNLSGTAPNLVYTPAAGFTGTDTLTFKVTENGTQSNVATVQIKVQAPASYTPPLGVPMPTFGITQTVASVYGSDGFYTHWVDPTHPQSTDSSNPNGTPTKPRKGIPGNVAAGSVVVIAGGTFNSGVDITAAGTASQPIFYRGLNPASKPLIKGKLAIFGAAKYVIVENLATDRDYQSSGVNIVGPAHHIAMRHCDVSDAQGAILIYDAVDNIVVFNNHIHDCGNLNASGDIDDNGVIIGEGANCWVLDNLVRHCVGSGIVLNPGFGEPNSKINHCYVGRNQVYMVRQSGVWSKQSQDCVFSQNTVFSLKTVSHTSADGIGFQYGPERLWILFNRVFDCEYGVRSGSNSVANPGQDLYIIGNVLHDIHDKRGQFDANNTWTNGGIVLPGGVNRFIYNNTVYNCDTGIGCAGDGGFTLSNNLVANITKTGANHVWIPDEAGNTNWTLTKNLLWQDGGAVKVKFRSTVYNVATLQANQASRASGNLAAEPALVAPTQGDFHPLSGSPVVDSGATMNFNTAFQASFGVPINVDSDGVPRPTDGNGDGTAGWDMGALEKQ